MPGPDAKLNLFLPTTAPFSNLDNPGRRKAQQHPSALAPEAQIGEYLPLHLPALPTGSGGGTLAKPTE